MLRRGRARLNHQSSPDSPEADYVERVNRGIDYVLARLEEPICLEDVARAACFSPYHFHRVFRSLLGETLNQFVKRLRLERALFMLSHSPRRALTICSAPAPARGPVRNHREHRDHRELGDDAELTR